MNLSTAILGKSAVDRLTLSAGEAILQIGRDQFTRADLARVGCYNFSAARNLSKIFHEALAVNNLREVYENIPPHALALPRLGVVSLAVLGAAFELKRIGGEAPLENYARKHVPRTGKNGSEEPTLTSFDTIKRKEHERTAAAKTRAKRRG